MCVCVWCKYYVRMCVCVVYVSMCVFVFVWCKYVRMIIRLLFLRSRSQRRETEGSSFQWVFSYIHHVISILVYKYVCVCRYSPGLM